MKVIEVSASKGGVGTTTVACGLAVAGHNNGQRTLIVGLGSVDDILSVMGAGDGPSSDGEPVEFLAASTDSETGAECGGLHLAWVKARQAPVDLSMYGDKYDLVIVDAGRLGFRKYRSSVDSTGRSWTSLVSHVRVVRNCYISLRNEVNATRTAKKKNISYVVHVEDGRPLTKSDVQSVLSGVSSSFTFVDMDSTVGRKIDAGLFAQQSREWAGTLV